MAPRPMALCGLLAALVAIGLAPTGLALPLPGKLSGPTATFELLDGRRMPVFGLGVYVTQPGPETYNAVKWALEAGYRMLDTAAVYGNEESVGEAIRDSGIPREEIWVTTKLWDDKHGYEQALKAGKESRARLGLEYIDLYLIHSPQTGKLVETWDAMVELRKRQIVRSIGVSNYNVQHIKALTDHGRELPAVNQFEMHPLLYAERKPLIDYCEQHKVLVQAYGSIFFGKTEFLEDPAVVEATAAHPGKTPAQVLLRWGLQLGFQVIPKSTKQHRIQENMNIFDFELSTSEMDRLSAMKGELGAYWNPLNSPVDLGNLGRQDL